MVRGGKKGIIAFLCGENPAPPTLKESAFVFKTVQFFREQDYLKLL